jgi:hypothetical protein
VPAPVRLDDPASMHHETTTVGDDPPAAEPEHDPECERLPGRVREPDRMQVAAVLVSHPPPADVQIGIANRVRLAREP